jgi:hypothetical protein
MPVTRGVASSSLQDRCDASRSKCDELNGKANAPATSIHTRMSTSDKSCFRVDILVSSGCAAVSSVHVHIIVYMHQLSKLRHLPGCPRSAGSDSSTRSDFDFLRCLGVVRTALRAYEPSSLVVSVPGPCSGLRMRSRAHGSS